MTVDATKGTDENKPKAEDVNILDIIKNKGLLRVPEEVVDVYTDADAAHQVEKLRQEQEKYPAEKTRSGAMLGDSITEGVVYPPEYHAIEKKIDELFERMEESKLVFKLRGIAPRLRDSIVDAAKVAGSNHFKDNATATQREKDEYVDSWFGIELLRRQTAAIEIPSIGGVQTSIEHAELGELTSSLYPGESVRLLTASYKIAEAAALTDAHDDAGFRRRKLDVAAQ